MDEERIITAINQLGDRLDGRLTELENRLDRQEQQVRATSKAARKTAAAQKRQGNDIEQLKRIVYGLAKNDPLRRWDSPPAAAVRKETAYADFERSGYSRREATCLLDEAGILRHDGSGKRAPAIWLDGKVERVLIVELAPEGGQDGEPA